MGGDRGTYVERRALATQGTQGDEEGRTVEMTLRLVAGTYACRGHAFDQSGRR